MINLKTIKHCASPSLARTCKQFFENIKSAKQNNTNSYDCKQEDAQLVTLEKATEKE